VCVYYIRYTYIYIRGDLVVIGLRGAPGKRGRREKREVFICMFIYMYVYIYIREGG